MLSVGDKLRNYAYMNSQFTPGHVYEVVVVNNYAMLFSLTTDIPNQFTWLSDEQIAKFFTLMNGGTVSLPTGSSPVVGYHYWEEEAMNRDKKQKEQVEEWKREGLCPSCGQLGKYIGMAPVCTVHGTYGLIEEEKTKYEEKKK